MQLKSMWNSIKARCKDGIVALEVVETQDDGGHKRRLVDIKDATADNLDRMFERAKTFAESGVPAGVFQMLEYGPRMEDIVVRSHFFGAS